ncbi:Crp/Fnr family transcriptional regulator [Microvirga brassicacearum]|uniref:Crp/Fnr family transcriptional regulator n=1 Tax=Microvirga brassicacearum TaxID=2580413 RepID=A0A5N3P4F3_9HYPH|nr:Crp/Fnr family transcriptional regulator [Microvirga brassicacearum]KAB0264592.1 Crp/Fnr family transcriptional regulator [Microvirga brassicacearum]
MNIPDWMPDEVSRVARRLSLSPGETLFCRGDEPKGLFIVESGEVRLSRVDLEGREITLFRAFDGDPVAEASLFSNAYHCDATAAAPTVVQLFPKAALLEAFDHDPPAARGFMAMLARQVMSLRTRLAAATDAIGQTHAMLSAAHLKYHLTTAALLTSAQIRQYDQLRGYGGSGTHDTGDLPIDPD